MKMKICTGTALLFLFLLPHPASAQSETSTLEQRLVILEDKEAIRTLLLDYGRHLDNRDWDAFAALFASEGGTWNGGMGIASGPGQIKDMMVSTIGMENAGANGSGLSNLHLLGNEFIEVSGNTATALSKWVFFMTAVDGGPEAVFLGHYADELIKIEGKWKFRERVVHGDIMRPSTVEGLNNAE
jgi:hypothetical protein